MTTTDTPKYKNFKAALDPAGWNWYENRNGNWTLTGFSLLVDERLNTALFTAIGKRGKALRGGFSIALDAFVDVAARLLAYLWDVPEECIRNAKQDRENCKGVEARLRRYELALNTILEEFERVPDYMGDAEFGNKLATILISSREYADYNEITEVEYRQLTDESYEENPSAAHAPASRHGGA